jgi:uncharacterized protein YecT (DUF1311 family)
MKNILFLLFISSSFPVFSEELKPIDSLQAIGGACTGLEQSIDESIAICFNGKWEDPCATGSSYGSDICASNELENENEELNRKYNLIIEKFGESEHDKLLKYHLAKSHKEWVEYRDSICSFEREKNFSSRAETYCLTSVTKHKNEALNILLNGCEYNGICVAPW